VTTKEFGEVSQGIGGASWGAFNLFEGQPAKIFQRASGSRRPRIRLSGALRLALVKSASARVPRRRRLIDHRLAAARRLPAPGHSHLVYSSEVWPCIDGRQPAVAYRSPMAAACTLCNAFDNADSGL
jgi:hypothetical protein